MPAAGIENHPIRPPPSSIFWSKTATIHCGKAHFGTIDTRARSPTPSVRRQYRGHAAGPASYLSRRISATVPAARPRSLFAIPDSKNTGTAARFSSGADARSGRRARWSEKYGQPFSPHVALHRTRTDRPRSTFQQYKARGMTTGKLRRIGRRHGQSLGVAGLRLDANSRRTTRS